jgi:hypothetical protein
MGAPSKQCLALLHRSDDGKRRQLEQFLNGLVEFGQEGVRNQLTKI